VGKDTISIIPTPGRGGEKLRYYSKGKNEVQLRERKSYKKDDGGKKLVRTKREIEEG